MTDSLVTIVIGCWNDADFLPESLGSLVEQTCSNWEAVVVDDGSSIGDPAAAVDALRDSRIRCIRHDRNMGPAAARNTGVRNSTGELLVVLDADDRLDRAYVEKASGFMSANPSCAVVFPDFYRFGREQAYLDQPLLASEMILQRQWIPFPGTMIRRLLWEKIGGYCEAEELRAGNEDWDFWLSAFERGLLEVGHIPEPLYWYRERVDSQSRRLRRSEWLTREFICRRHGLLFETPSVRRAFLSEGYWRSAKSAWQRGEPLLALRLAVKGLWLGPRGSMNLAVRTSKRAIPGQESKASSTERARHRGLPRA